MAAKSRARHACGAPNTTQAHAAYVAQPTTVAVDQDREGDPKACHIPKGYPVPTLSTGGARLSTTDGTPSTFGRDYVDTKYMHGRRAMWTRGREGRRR
jgi:hypothetical protein